MFLSISSSLTNGLLAQLVVGTIPEPFLLAMFGASLLLVGSFVHWLGKRNVANDIHDSNNREMTKIDEALPAGVQATSTLPPLGLDWPLGSGADVLTSAARALQPQSPGSDSNLTIH